MAVIQEFYNTKAEAVGRVKFMRKNGYKADAYQQASTGKYRVVAFPSKMTASPKTKRRKAIKVATRKTPRKVSKKKDDDVFGF
jgi:hypothetical protein